MADLNRMFNPSQYGQSVPQQAPQYMTADMVGNMPQQDQFVQPVAMQPTPQLQPSVASQTQTTRKLMPDGSADILKSALGDLTAAQQKKLAAIDMQIAAEDKINELQAARGAEAAQANLDMAIKFDETQKRYNEAVNGAEKSMLNAKNAYESSSIDSNRIFKGDNNNRMLAAISLGLGAFGASMTGQRNYAMDMINGIIDRDIEEQKGESQKKYTSYENAKKERQILDTNFGTEIERLAMAKNMRLESVNSRIDGLIASAKSPLTRANGMKLKADVQEQIANTKANLYTIATQNAATETTTTGGVGKSASDVQYERQQSDAALEYSAFKNDMLGTYKEAGQYQVVAGKAPSWLGGSAGEFDALKAKLAGAIIGKVPGIKSDSDFNNIIVPMLPKPQDPPKTIEKKYQIFEQYINSAAPAAYLKTTNQQQQMPKSFIPTGG